MQRIEITHTTKYSYPEPVRFLEHKLHVRPREGHDIRIEASELMISPAYTINWQRDVYGNSVAIVNFNEQNDALEIVSTVVVEHYDTGSSAPELAEDARQFPFAYNPMEQIDLVPYQTMVFAPKPPIFLDWLEAIWQPGQLIDTMSFLNQLNRRIADDFAYLVRDEPGVQSPEKTLSTGKGS